MIFLLLCWRYAQLRLKRCWIDVEFIRDWQRKRFSRFHFVIHFVSFFFFWRVMIWLLFHMENPNCQSNESLVENASLKPWICESARDRVPRRMRRAGGHASETNFKSFHSRAREHEHGCKGAPKFVTSTWHFKTTWGSRTTYIESKNWKEIEIFYFLHLKACFLSYFWQTQ